MNDNKRGDDNYSSHNTVVYSETWNISFYLHFTVCNSFIIVNTASQFSLQDTKAHQTKQISGRGFPFESLRNVVCNIFSDKRSLEHNW